MTPVEEEARREQELLVERTEGRGALDALRADYSRRLHQQSGDLEATHGLRLVTAKLQRTSSGPTVVTRFS